MEVGPTANETEARRSANEIEVLSAHEAIRRRPSMYFQEGRFTEHEVIGRIVDTAVLAGVERVEVAHESGWWIVSSTQDWFPASVRDDKPELDPFMTLPVGGRIFPEIFLTACATDVVTCSPDGVRVVKGTADESLTRWLERATTLGRVVAFRV